MAYSDKVIQHYEKPNNVGNFGTTAEVKQRKDVGVGIVGVTAGELVAEAVHALEGGSDAEDEDATERFGNTCIPPSPDVGDQIAAPAQSDMQVDDDEAKAATAQHDDHAAQCSPGSAAPADDRVRRSRHKPSRRAPEEPRRHHHHGCTHHRATAEVRPDVHVHAPGRAVVAGQRRPCRDRWQRTYICRRCRGPAG